MKDANFYLEHPEEWDKLGAEEQAQVTATAGSLFDGDMSGHSETITPAVAPEKVEEKLEEKPQVLAKDGKHTIPYERFEEVQGRAKEAEEAKSLAERLQQTVTEQQKLIDDLKTAAKTDEGTGGTAAQEGVIAEYTGEYPELMEDLKPYLEQMLKGQGGDQVAALRAEIASLREELAPVKKSHEQSQQEAEELDKANWRSAQEDFWKDEANAAFSQNETLLGMLNQEVIRLANAGSVGSYPEMLATAKANIVKSVSTITKTPPDVAAIAAAKLAGVEQPVPYSLSDVPGGIQQNEIEAAANMGMRAATAKMMTMSADDQEAWFSKIGL